MLWEPIESRSVAGCYTKTEGLRPARFIVYNGSVKTEETE